MAISEFGISTFLSLDLHPSLAKRTSEYEKYVSRSATFSHWGSK